MIQKYHKDSKHSKYVQLTSFPTHCFPNYRIYSIRPFPKKKIKYDKKKKKKKESQTFKKRSKFKFYTRERSSLEKPAFMDHVPFSSLCSLFSCAEAAGNSEVPLETVPSQHDRAVLDRGSVTETEIRREEGGGRIVCRSYCQCHDPVSVAARLPPPSDPESIPETVVLRHLGRSANP